MSRKLTVRLLGTVTAIVVAGAAASCSGAATSEVPTGGSGERAQAVFAGGCFWCTESDFDKIPGVLATTSGYTGGEVANPSYKQVSAGGTGHIEAVRVIYNPAKVSYAELVVRYFRTIDPLDAGGQFCDRGYQYRSAIFVANDKQRRIAETAVKRVGAELDAEVATLVLPAAKFYSAEKYHQNYYKKNPVRYRFYRLSCGRDARLKQIWD